MRIDVDTFVTPRIGLGRRLICIVLMPMMALNAPPVLAQAQEIPTKALESTVPTYPAPVTTPINVKVNRKLPLFNPVSSQFNLPDQPTDQDIFKHSLFEEPLVPVGGKTTATDNAALGQALVAFSKRTERDDFSALESFLTAHPTTPWRMALLTNLGWSYRQTGWYSKSMIVWEEAWALGKNEKSPTAKAIADRALSELVVLNARLGRIERLGPLFKEIKTRIVTGSALEKINAAKQGYDLMISHPERGYRCGPMALETLRQHSDKPIPASLLVKTEPSTVKGTSLTQIYRLSKKLSLNLIMAKRTPGSALLVPSVVNWKVGHFAAIIGQKKGLIHLHDPTFSDDVWISSQALDAESSGYFLVKDQPLPAGWSPVSEDEGKTIWGKGPTATSNPKCLNCENSPQTSGCSSCGMATVSIFKMLASLSVRDTPLFYQPAYGPSTDFTITYAQRESAQPSTFTYSNLGPLWTCNWISYITDDPANPGADVTQYLAGGGEMSYTGFDETAQAYVPQQQNGSVLKLTSSTSYERDNPDGSKQIFSAANTTSPRKVFLTQIVDSTGFTVTYTYDSSYRLVGATDATGLVSTVAYASTDSSTPAFYQIATVTDPFGRTASFSYDSSGRLASSTDMIGLVSQYNYDPSSTMTSLVTPYGTTKFSTGQDGDKRWVQITDPQGGLERLETWNNQNTTVVTPPASAVPSGMDNGWLQYRNTFYWNKKQMMTNGSTLNYANAEDTQWIHEDDLSTMSGQVESVTQPLESRAYRAYQGQLLNLELGPTGYTGAPIRSVRVLSNGAFQETDNQYSTTGMLTQTQDPLGRITYYSYDTNGIDLLQVSQKNGTNTDILSTTTYNSLHEPLTVKDASGQTTTYTYFTNGQVHTVTNARGEMTTYAYDINGRLASITGPVTGSTTSMTYDPIGRLATQTDINGYTIRYGYDALNRVTLVTYPDGTYDQNVYTNLDRTLSRDRQGRWTRYLYNATRQLVGVVDPQGRVTSYERCNCGELNAIVDANGHRTSWTYDLQGRTTAKTYADGSHINYVYDSGYTSRLLSRTDTAGNITIFTYNLDNTLASTSYTTVAGFSATPTVSYTYDPAYKRIIGMTDGTGSTSYTYYPVYTSGTPITGGNQVETITGPLGSTAAITYSYDELGRALGTSINGISSSVNYDSLGRMIGASNPLGNFTYAYYGVTPRLHTVSNDQNGLNSSYSYQTSSTGDFRLTDITNYQTGTTVLSKFDYSYNPVGTIATWQQQTDSNTPALWTYGYDNADQVVAATQTNTSTNAVLSQYVYGYDPAGNRLTEQVGLNVTQTAYNNLNQITGTSAGGALQFSGTTSKPSQVTVAGSSATYANSYTTNFSGTANVTTGTNSVPVIATDVNGNAATNNYQVVVPSGSTASPTYDANGNMLTNGSGQSYAWDAKNELVKISYADTSSSVFSYDGLSRRTKIVEENSSATVTSTKQYVFISDDIAEERDADNNVIKRYFIQGEQVPGSASPADKLYYTRDHLGSVRELVDSSGTIQARYSYDAFGRQSKVSGSLDSTFQYAGYYEHSTSGLNLTKYRAYDPNTARWLSRDPIGSANAMRFNSRTSIPHIGTGVTEILTGSNLYAYCRNQPTARIDKLGLSGAYNEYWRFPAIAPYPGTPPGGCFNFWVCHIQGIGKGRSLLDTAILDGDTLAYVAGMQAAAAADDSEDFSSLCSALDTLYQEHY